MPLERDLFDSTLVLDLFRHHDRASLRDFLPALQLVDDRLAHFAPKKEGSPWDQKSVDTHLVHVVKHVSAALTEVHDYTRLEEQLAAVVLRAQMALQVLHNRNREGHPGSVSDLRAISG